MVRRSVHFISIVLIIGVIAEAAWLWQTDRQIRHERDRQVRQILQEHLVRDRALAVEAYLTKTVQLIGHYPLRLPPSLASHGVRFVYADDLLNLEWPAGPCIVYCAAEGGHRYYMVGLGPNGDILLKSDLAVPPWPEPPYEVRRPPPTVGL
jgi:hypothetical protein